MSEPSRLLSWLAVLAFVAGAFVAFLRARDYYRRRGWAPDPLKLADDDEKYPLLKLDLRRWK